MEPAHGILQDHKDPAVGGLRCSHCTRGGIHEGWLFWGVLPDECGCGAHRYPKGARVGIPRLLTFRDLQAATTCDVRRVDWVACSQACADALLHGASSLPPTTLVGVWVTAQLWECRCARDRAPGKVTLTAADVDRCAHCYTRRPSVCAPIEG